MAAIDDVKTHLKEKKLVMGTRATLKALKRAELSTVYLSSNCAPAVKSDVERYCSMNGCTVEHLDVPNEELGSVCRKPFAVSVLGLLK